MRTLSSGRRSTIGRLPVCDTMMGIVRVEDVLYVARSFGRFGSFGLAAGCKEMVLVFA